MARKFLGVELLGPEQIKRNLMIAGLFAICLAAGLVVLFSYIGWVDQRGHRVAKATVTAVENQCRYIVGNIARRQTTYDHTGFIDCATAEQVARENDFALGRVERTLYASIDFTTEDGVKISSQVRLFKQLRASVGSTINILYREDIPAEVKEYKDFSLMGLFASDRPRSPEAIARDEARKKYYDEKRAKKEIDPLGLAILIVLLVIGFFAVRRLYRFVRSLMGRGQPAGVSAVAAAPVARAAAVVTPRTPAPRPGTPCAAPTQSRAASERLNRIVGHNPRPGFGQR